MVELAVARAEVEATVVADAARAAVAELEALRASSTDNSVSTDDAAVVHPQGHRGSSPDECGSVSGALGGGARGGRAPDGGGSSDRRGRFGGWVDEDCDIYKRCDSLSLDRYHSHHGIQAIVRDVGPGGGWLSSPRPTTSSGPR
jgi:CO/xanthine dehydrogenase Mo-binding subunit